MKPAIKLMIVDDHPAFRLGLNALIKSQPDMELVAETGDGREAVELFRRSKPDVVLMDLRLPGLSGVEAIMAIKKDFSDARIVVVTTYDWDEDIYRAIRLGAMSYLLKDMPMEEMLKTIRAAHAGEQTLPPQVAKLLEQRSDRKDLTPREIEVLHLLAKGRSNKEIGVALKVTEETIKSHLRTLFLKLGVRDRTEAVISAVRHGIVHVD
jgi:two-component system NarL family response regulator